MACGPAELGRSGGGAAHARVEAWSGLTAGLGYLLHAGRRRTAGRCLVFAGHVIELPGYFRICLTATDDMVDHSLPIFAHVIEQARSSLPA
ncbi:MAG: hypothetical protein M3319_12860 [Actinomycetota bacterium]|nr:hypothetical protein [Actinomycetota bacterium]